MGLPFLAAIWFIPESPTYLIKIGNQDRARKVLEKLGNEQKSKVFRALLLTYCILLVDLDSSQRAIKSMEEKLLRDQLNKKNFWNSWKRAEIVKPFISGVTLMAFFQVPINH